MHTLPPDGANVTETLCRLKSATEIDRKTVEMDMCLNSISAALMAIGWWRSWHFYLLWHECRVSELDELGTPCPSGGRY